MVKTDLLAATYAQVGGVEVPEDSTDVIIVRHGETTWNHDHRLQGQTDTPLNETGKAQAEAVGARLGSCGLDIAQIFSSDLSRAYDTAMQIAKRIGQQVIRLEALRERHLGVLQGFTPRESKEKQPKAYSAFVSHLSSLTIPGGGESLDEVKERASKALESIAKGYRGRRVVVVAHGGTMNVLHEYATGKEPPSKVVNAAINLVRVHVDGSWNVLLWGDIAHLKACGYDKSAFGGGVESA
eukprot:TRINITY_DN4337_c0_g1_i1.p2 TRINITY_DN4337_c0_g1~~TRINITY_DN4337_c0_g1_i1.p2  ORF type:complete len:240 (+),score=44.65 TRINITY_DN4337_c0_g1_i1:82-801(+)